MVGAIIRTTLLLHSICVFVLLVGAASSSPPPPPSPCSTNQQQSLPTASKCLHCSCAVRIRVRTAGKVPSTTNQIQACANKLVKMVRIVSVLRGL